MLRDPLSPTPSALSPPERRRSTLFATGQALPRTRPDIRSARRPSARASQRATHRPGQRRAGAPRRRSGSPTDPRRPEGRRHQHCDVADVHSTMTHLPRARALPSRPKCYRRRIRVSRIRESRPEVRHHRAGRHRDLVPRAQAGALPLHPGLARAGPAACRDRPGRRHGASPSAPPEVVRSSSRDQTAGYGNAVLVDYGAASPRRTPTRAG